MKTHPLAHLRIAAISAAAVILQMGPAHAAPPAEAFANFTDDGGWCWFADPRAVSGGGKTYTGWVTEDGSIEAASLEHATGRITTFTLHAKYERDDHDNPSFLFLPDGRLRAFYTRHSTVEEINSRVTARPGDITEWEPETTIVPKDTSPKNNGITYSNPFMLSEENNAIHLFWRGKSFKPTTATSTDGGNTWSPATPVFSMPGLPPGNRPYAKYASNGKDRIHMLFTNGHPRNETTNSVYYVCYRAGSYYKADGTLICGADGLPITPDQADLIYDATKTGARGWIWEIAFDAKDQPVVVYTRHPSETDHHYHYARWTGREWLDTELCPAGKWFPQTPSGKSEREPHYSSGLAIDPADPSIVYLTRPVNGVRELEKWTTTDGGKTWKSEAITANSKHDNIRPYVVRNHAPDGPTVLWQNISGRYVHYTDYRCSIKMDRTTAPGLAKPRVVTVTNPADFPRTAETVEVSMASLPKNPVVREDTGPRVLDSQVAGSQLLFQVDLAPGETRRFLVSSAEPAADIPPATAKTFCRFVPERLDDFAWESDRIAFRTYGPAVMTAPGEMLVSSGIDVWVKSTRQLVIDKWYKSGDYHEDHGEGLDGYKVGPARGCGGSGIWDGKKLHPSANFKSWKVLANGPLRSVFELSYDDWDAGGHRVSEIKRISIDAGSNFSRIESTFRSDRPGPLEVAVGIVKREGDGQFTKEAAGGWMSYWEPESPPNGHTACAVVIPGGASTGFAEADGNFLALGKAETGKPFVHYMGAGWSKSGDFPNPKSWEAAVRDLARRLKSPLVVTVE